MLRHSIRLILIIFPVYGSAQDYFQQEVNNTIYICLNETSASLHGHIQIEYINNSPDTLESIYFHLWPNAYKNTQTAFAQQQELLRSTRFRNSDATQNGYIDSLCFSVNKRKASLMYTENADIVLLALPAALFPGDTVVIETPFYVKIPDAFSRLGHKNKSFQITQWYPKPAVYDQFGWHAMPYLDMGEFYSEFGSFDVSINVPQHYIVAATGELVTKSELEWLEDMALKTKQRNYETRSISPEKRKVLRYIESDIHDFAWFADAEFVVAMDTVIIDNTGSYVRCWTFSRPENSDTWDNAVNYVKEAVRYCSRRVGKYPYRNCTAVDGELMAGGGMEYPGITVVSAGGSKKALERVIVHEVFHNWFYGILASNERQFPWIDEGFTSFYEQSYFYDNYRQVNLSESYAELPLKVPGIDLLQRNYVTKLAYRYLRLTGLDQATNLSSTDYSPANYFVMSYQKPVLALQHLESYLGRSDFDRLIQYYFNRWKFKHPYPGDIQQSFLQCSGDSLNWFFDDLIGSNKTLDYAIGKVKSDSVLVVNKGEIEAPLLLYCDDSLVVYKGFSGKKWVKITGNCNSISIDKELLTTDLHFNNNYYQPNAILKESEKPRITLGGFFDIPQRSELNFVPAIGLNHAQKIMAGVVLYNITLTEKPVEWYVMPLFSPFGYRDIHTLISGMCLIKINASNNNSLLRHISFSSRLRKFSYEIQNSEIPTHISWISVLNTIKHSFRKNHLKPYADSYLQISLNSAGGFNADFKHFINLQFRHKDERVINPYGINLELEKGPGYVKTFTELEYKISYNKKHSGFSIRVFGGKFLYNASEYYGNFNFRMAGDLSLQDYQFREIYYARGSDIRQNAANLWAHQFCRNQGGFVSYSPLGQSNNWLAAVNLSTSMPVKFIKLFFNAARWQGIDNFWYSHWFAWETGVEVSIIPNVCSVFFPVWVSNDIRNTQQIYFDNYFEKIRFTLNLTLVNPMEFRNKIPYLI